MKEIKNLREENKYLKERLNSLLSQNKYGLKWKDYKEKNEEVKYTVIEDKEMEIKTNSQKQMEHLFFEGDNLLALRELSKTHKEKIDVIYIDPPYNTGNEFIYNDKKQEEQGDKHSAWLSFMSKRLEIAEELLTEDGVIFVSIDDNEQAQLKLLMDKVFGEENFISKFHWKKKKSQGTDSKHISNIYEYIYCYAKNKDVAVFSKLTQQLKGYNLEDEHVKTRGRYKLNKMDRGTLGYSESLDYPILSPDGCIIYPNGRDRQYNDGWRWRWSKEKLYWGLNNDFIEFKKNKNNKWQVYYKMYTKVDNEGKFVDKTKTMPFTNEIPEYIGGTTKGTNNIKEIFGKVVFNYPKPVELLKYLINIHPKKEITVLDFFAGSGTTGQAVMELNKEDGGSRQFILCTNNEVSEEKERKYLAEKGCIEKPHKKLYNKFKKEHLEQYEAFLRSEEYQQLGIARSVTYERLKRVIEGYTTPKGKEVEGLDNNKITYFKID